MNVYFTTVVRSAPQDRGGELVSLNWQRKAVLARVPMRPHDPAVVDPNPRGSTRGGRGIVFVDELIAAASYHTLELFEPDLKPAGRITNPLFAGLHEACREGDTVWASSTCIDYVVRVDRAGNTIEDWTPRDDPATARSFNLPPSRIDKGIDNRACNVGTSDTSPGHVHLNAVAMQDGRPLVLLNRFGAVVRLRPTEVIVRDESLRGCHNIVVTRSGQIIVNDTRGRNLRVFDCEGKPVCKIDLLELEPVRELLRKSRLQETGWRLATRGRPRLLFRSLFGRFTAARPLFVRGLAETPRGTLLVGLSPATILALDPSHNWRLVDHFNYSADVNCCVHGIAVTGN